MKDQMKENYNIELVIKREQYHDDLPALLEDVLDRTHPRSGYLMTHNVDDRHINIGFTLLAENFPFEAAKNIVDFCEATKIDVHSIELLRGVEKRSKH